jgi:outer membrane protein assembly factor BamB
VLPNDPDSVEKEYHATFASTDGFLYGVDIVSGVEVWAYQMASSGFEAPVVDDMNIIYVGDGKSILHAVKGGLSCAGCFLWTDSSLASGASTDIVKLGITNTNALVVGTGTRAFALFQ